MKLYTEEQLRNSMNSMKTYIKVYNESVIDKIVENHIKALGGVELPSDEEMEEQSWGYREVTKDIDIPPNEDWCNGAKWMRDKIQGGNNGNNNSN